MNIGPIMIGRDILLLWQVRKISDHTGGPNTALPHSSGMRCSERSVHANFGAVHVSFVVGVWGMHAHGLHVAFESGRIFGVCVHIHICM